jgi:hypothetical protein
VVKAASAGFSVSVKCVRCKADRGELPDADRSRMPSPEADGSVTITMDTACRCGATRARVKLELG